MANYTVKNIYGINGETHHKTAIAALRAKSRREGMGWVVSDAAGNIYDMYAGRVVVTESIN